MWAPLLLLLSLCLVHVDADDSKRDLELSARGILGAEFDINRNIREAKKQSGRQKEKKRGSTRKAKKKIQRRIKNGKAKRGKKENNKKKGRRSKIGKRKSKQRSYKKTSKKLKGKGKSTIKKSSARQTCDSGINTACMEAAKTVLVFEGNQVINFIKKYLRYGRQETVIGNKLGKKGNFSSAKKHMDEAMNGNITKLSGCKTESSKVDFTITYDFLSNCSTMIKEKCTYVGPDTDQMTAMATCYTEMSKFKNETEKCRKISTGEAQCACWTQLESTMNAIKELEPKCMGTMDTMAKATKTGKKTCTEAFSMCKRAEDASVGLIYNCMDFDVQAMNQSAIASDAGAKITGY